MASPRGESFDAAAAAEFLEASAGWPPRAILLDAAERLEALAHQAERGIDSRNAIDLGCGAGTETIELLRRGWHVHAVDAHRACLDLVLRRAEEAGVSRRLAVEAKPFERLDLPEDRYDLVHAGFSIPFCAADAFDPFWRRLTRSTRRGGLFAGQFFGPREPLILAAPAGSATAHDAASIRRLFGPDADPWWRVLVLDEVERAGRGPRGEPKHWHVFHAILERTEHVGPPGRIAAPPRSSSDRGG